MPDTLRQLQDRLGHTFASPALLEQAVAHPSYANEHTVALPNNQRLEFLGDSVLQLILSAALYSLHPTEPEGVLSRHRANLANGRRLARLAVEIGLDHALRLGVSEEATGGRSRASNLEDAFEAVIGALYLDAGFDVTRDRVLALYGPLDARVAESLESDNPKGRLQERIHPVHGNSALRYETVHAAGADHQREYASRVFLCGAPLGEGRGSSKKSAEEAAARSALSALPPSP